MSDSISGISTLHELIPLRQCPKCGYDLRALSDLHVCPECGFARTESTITLPFHSHETAWIVRICVVGLVAVLLLGVAPMLYFRGVAWGIILAVVLGPSLLIAVLHAVHRRRRRAVTVGSVALFTDEGVAMRQFGSWSSVMPYHELTRLTLRRIGRSDRWRLRLSMSFLGLPMSWVRGIVHLDEKQAAALGHEINQRIERDRAE